ncbi:MAG: T9SS type A sorting domain-containing protein [Chitinophagales bacterium]|nr:T9SS type A sorting domain-containing protein [Chitinophagales bacterium]
MKNFLLIAICLLIFKKSFSQANVYHPFPLDGGEWRADYFDEQCFGICEKRNYYTRGDTTIGNATYKKLYADIVPEVGNAFYGEYFGALREDTVNRKIYYFCSCSPEETILFDFDLDSGEVLPQTWLHDVADTMLVSSIDSILIDNSYHKKFNLTNTTGYPVALIEGVGWSGGLILEKIYSLIGWEVIYNLKCMKVNGEIQYLDTSYVYPSCDLPLAIENINIASVTSLIYPNPVPMGSTIYLNLTYPQQYKVKVLDITGRSVRPVIFSANSIYLPPDTFQKGIYLFEISKDKKQQPFFVKLIIL